MSSKTKGKSGLLRKKSVLPLSAKIQILDRLSAGEKIVSVARDYKVNESTIRSIKRVEDKVRSSITTSLTVKLVRDPAIERMETNLLVWIEEKGRKKIPLTGRMIRKKAMKLYTQFKGSDEFKKKVFIASEGWLSSFKARYSLNYKMLGTKQSSPKHIDIPDTELSRDNLSDMKLLQNNADTELSQNNIDTNLANMHDPLSIKTEASTSTTLNLSNLRKAVQMADELGDFFIELDPSMERSALFKIIITKATAEYVSELESMLIKTEEEQEQTSYSS